MEHSPYTDILHRMRDDLVLRGLSPRTVDSYLTHARLFLAWCARPTDTLDTEDIRRFLAALIAEHDLAPSTVNIYSAAIRFLFAVTLNHPLNYLQIPRQKEPDTLPVVLHRTEVAAILAQAAVPQHRALLTLIYGSGLRISEAAAMKVPHIDSAAMRVRVVGGKGSQDRYTLLSKAALTALREYWRACRPQHPDGWLFPGSCPSGHITSAGIRFAFNQAVARAQITSPVTVHTLRHCFATHLLEDGATLLQIKELLGHRSIQSTTLYLHLANLTAGLQSPLDAFTGQVAHGD